jgi:hypothetical protein
MFWPDKVAHANLVNQEVEIAVLVQPTQKVCEAPSPSMARHSGTCLSSPGRLCRRILNYADLGIKGDIFQK